MKRETERALKRAYKVGKASPQDRELISNYLYKLGYWEASVAWAKGQIL